MITIIIIYSITHLFLMGSIILLEGMIIGDLYIKAFEEYMDATFIDVPPWVVRRARVRLSRYLRLLFVALFLINLLVLIFI